MIGMAPYILLERSKTRERDEKRIISPTHFDVGMSLERVHLDILRYLYDTGGVSRKILFQSVNYKPKQIEKACDDLESKGYVELHAGFYKSEWASISITDEGMDYLELQDDA